MLTASVGIINQDLDITTSDNEDGYFLYQPGSTAPLVGIVGVTMAVCLLLSSNVETALP